MATRGDAVCEWYSRDVDLEDLEATRFCTCGSAKFVVAS